MAAFAVTPTWSDEFTGPAGSPPDPSKWGYNVGGPGWGNGEVQVYTSSRKNSGLDGKGHLLITVQRTGNNYTSAYLTTNDKFEFTYGRVEASIKMPVGNGMNSAFWTVGTNIDTVGWPQSGEIDMVEYLGKGNSYHVGLHGPLTAQPSTQWQYGVDPKTSSNLSAGYHTYWVEKEPDKVTVGIDDTVVKTWTRDSLAPGEEWVFEAPSHVLLDVAVGGTFAGPVPKSTKFPASMSVDYVRYYAYIPPATTAAAKSAPETVAPADAGQHLPVDPVVAPPVTQPPPVVGAAPKPRRTLSLALQSLLNLAVPPTVTPTATTAPVNETPLAATAITTERDSTSVGAVHRTVGPRPRLALPFRAGLHHLAHATTPTDASSDSPSNTDPGSDSPSNTDPGSDSPSGTDPGSDSPSNTG
jgi:beta-glucanase (GH16 family)